MIVFISGLPGSGKSTVGVMVAQKFGWAFVEADDFLSQEAKEQVKAGQLLSPEQLDSWVVDGVIPNLILLEKKGPVVASGLLSEEKFVSTLSARSLKILYINLEVPYEVLKQRVSARDHFAGADILEKCWELRDKLVLPGPTINAAQSLQKVVEDVARKVDLFK